MTLKQRASCRASAVLWMLCAAFLTPQVWSGPARINEPIKPLRQIDGLNPAKVALGDKLFQDARLSTDNTISCASCHVISSDGSDSLPTAIGVGGAKGPVKTPTVWNSAYNFVQFWDGRAVTLEEQIEGPIHNPIEMSSSWDEAITKLQHDPAIVSAFNSSYPDGITRENIEDAIATFERSLVAVDSPFDRWLQGDDTALSVEALRGYQLFKSYGCISCHQGQNVGGNMFATMGAVGYDYFAERGGEITESDLGRYNVTGEYIDRYMFKVPSLRLVSRQSYFFHDGSTSSLTEAVQSMAHYQLGRNINASDASTIIVFLESLVGKHPRLEP
jgi:cytochrome c peroxidase